MKKGHINSISGYIQKQAERACGIFRERWFVKDHEDRLKWWGLDPCPSEPVVYSLNMDPGCQATVAEVNELIREVPSFIGKGQTVTVVIPDGTYDMGDTSHKFHNDGDLTMCAESLFDGID